ncbi:MAG: hypothetical protein CMK06_12410 [Ponticaulis sp.]|nr:hypothetical protein [Ponticaulis sp.]|tara:strand:- start:1202 stop:2083 length:882 start_codon:yes stop_codon:yes gene_type:complete
MKYALPASVIFHVAIGASGLFAWSIAPSGPTETYVEVPLDIVELANETNIQEVVRPRPEPPPEPEEEEVVDQEGEDEPVSEAEPEPEPAAEEEVPAMPEEPEAEEPEPPPPEPEPTPEPTPTPEPSPTPVVRKTTPPKNSDPLGDLLGQTEDLLQDRKDEDVQRERRASNRALEDQEETQRRGAGEKTQNKATVLDFVKSYIIQEGCWRSTKDLPDWENLDVTVQFRLDAKGRLLGQPRVHKSARPVNNDPFIRAAADRAIRAISNCEPFPLPEEDYDLWRNEDLRLTFDETL